MRAHRRALSCAVAGAIALLSGGLAPALRAQQPVPPAAITPPTGAAPVRIPLTAGRSTVLTTDFDITRMAITNDAIANAVAVEPRQILIDGKAVGTVSLIIWGTSRRDHYDIVVEPPISNLQQQLQALFPGENIRVSQAEDAVVLSGAVSSNTVMLRAAEIARASATKAKIINMLQLPGGQESDQVMLQVRFAEVNRRAVTELGVALFASRQTFSTRSTTQQFGAPNFDDFEEQNIGGLVFSDFLNLFFLSRTQGIGAVVKALQQKGFFQSLAEPNLIAYNGEEASFLAGGEIPIPVVQGATGTATIEWKEFGIRLKFRPFIAGDVIRLHVAPEVSTLDFANGVSLGGFRVPALSVRRAETEVELRDGQSFAIAGLLDNLTQTNNAGIPLLSSLPIIGHLFKSKADRAERTELLVLITPRLVRALDPDEVPPLPTVPGRFLPPPGVGIGGKLEGGGGPVDAPPADKKESPKPVKPPKGRP